MFLVLLREIAKLLEMSLKGIKACSYDSFNNLHHCYNYFKAFLNL